MRQGWIEGGFSMSSTLRFLGRIIRRREGFSLTETVIAMAVMSVLAAATMPKLYQKYEEKLIERTATEVYYIQVAAKKYRLDIGSWPLSISDLKNTGYLPSDWDGKNAWGNDYSISNNGTNLTVSTVMPDKYRDSLKTFLPYVSVSGSTVSATVPVPGAEPSLSLYLKKSGEDPMSGDLTIQKSSPALKLYDTVSGLVDTIQNSLGRLVFKNNAGTEVASIDQSGNAVFSGNVQARSFVDSDNSNFYVDPSGSTRLNTLTVTGGISVNGSLTSGTAVYAPVYYDSANQAYYLDPASTSNLNAVVVNTINGGTPVHSGNIATYAVTRINAGSGLTGGGGPGVISLSLATSGVGAGTYGSQSSVPVISVDTYGRITSASNVSIAIDASQITSGILPVARGGTGTGTTLTGVVLGGNPFAAVAASGGNQVLRRNAANTSYEFVSISGGGDPVGTGRTIIAGTGLTGGGDLSANRTISLAASGVTAGTYGSGSNVPVITVDTYGRITSASNTPVAIDASQVTSGVLPVARGGTGTGSVLTGVVLGGNPFAAVAASGGNQVLRRNAANTGYEFVSISGGGDPVGTGRSILAGTGLTGGGNLSQDRTISVNFGSSAGTVAEGSKTITITAGSNLTGGGTITIGAGGSTSLAVVSSPNFTSLLIGGVTAIDSSRNVLANSIYTGGTQRLDSSGNLTNVGTISSSYLTTTSTYTSISGDLRTTGSIFPGSQTSYYLYADTGNSGLRTNGNFLINGNIYYGTGGVWLSSWLNQSVRTDASPSFTKIIDTDNPSYYVDPSSSSVLNSLSVNTINGGTPIHSGNIAGYAVTGVSAGAGLSGGGGPGAVSLSLAASGVTAGTYGTASRVPVITVDAYGRITSASNTDIAIAASQITSGVLPVERGGTGTGSVLNGIVVGGNPFSAVAATGGNQVLRRNAGNTAYEFVSISGGGDPVGTGRTIATGAGLTGGGNLSADRTISLAASGVGAGTYGSQSSVPVITVDTYGRITSASNTSIAIDASQITSGVLPVARGGTGTGSTLTGVVLGGNPFTSVAASAGNQVLRRNAGNTAYEFVSISGGGDPVGTGRTIVAGTGLTGGGDLSQNRTISVNFGSSAGTVAEGNRTITVGAGSNLTGGGTITIGAGGSVTLSVVSSPDFSSLLIGGSTVIDSSRNVLANNLYTGGTLRLDSSGNLTNIGTISSTYFSTGGSYANVAGELRIGGTAVIDSSRNLINITRGAIGTNWPYDYLHVYGNWFDSDTNTWGGGIRIQGNAPTISFWETDDGSHRWMWHLSGDVFNLYRRPAGGGWERKLYVDNTGNLVLAGSLFPGGQTSYYLYADTGNSGLRTNGNFLVNGNIYYGTGGVWLSSWLNQSVRTDASPSFSSLYVGGSPAIDSLKNVYANNLYTGGTPRLDSSGNLVSIGTISSSYLTTGASYVNVLGELRINGTTVIDTSRNVFANNLYTGGTLRLDSSGNLVNIGNISASGVLALGSSPAQSGIIRIPNQQWIAGRNAANSGDVSMIRVNASNQVELGADVNILGGIYINGSLLANSSKDISARTVYASYTADTGKQTVYAYASQTSTSTDYYNRAVVGVARGASSGWGYAAGVVGLADKSMSYYGVGVMAVLQSGTSIPNVPAVNTALYASNTYGSGYSAYFTGAPVYFSGVNLSMSGTTIIDSSRNFFANNLYTGGTLRLDSSGNLTNIGTISSTYFSTGASYANVAGELRIGGTTVIDSSRNILNAGNITMSGSLNVPTSFDIKRSDTLAKLVNINASKTKDTAVTGYVSASDYYLKDKDIWVSEIGRWERKYYFFCNTTPPSWCTANNNCTPCPYNNCQITVPSDAKAATLSYTSYYYQQECYPDGNGGVSCYITDAPEVVRFTVSPGDTIRIVAGDYVYTRQYGVYGIPGTVLYPYSPYSYYGRNEIYVNGNLFIPPVNLATTYYNTNESLKGLVYAAPLYEYANGRHRFYFCTALLEYYH
jgi:prepilin-type N-terminal cleavage/methylation domain-containing protein